MICTLKHSDNTVSRRQEVGRGMRLAVNQSGDRMDDPAIVHQVNVLTVVANESYRDFVAGLQKDISASLSARPKQANEEYFKDKVLKTPTGDVKVTPQMAKLIERYLVKNDYSDTMTASPRSIIRRKRKAHWLHCLRNWSLTRSRSYSSSTACLAPLNSPRSTMIAKARSTRSTRTLRRKSSRSFGAASTVRPFMRWISRPTS